MKIYAMSDIHGCLAAFEEALSLIDLSQADVMLILLGDYIHGGENSRGVLKRIVELQSEHGSDKVMALLGNHEQMALEGSSSIEYMTRCDGVFDEPGDGTDHEAEDDRYLQWMSDLPRYYATEQQIFCHAGVDEEAGDLWEWSSDDSQYIWKYPAQTGPFCMDIIAGHVHTSRISGNPYFHDIYYDGESHYYIDGDTVSSGVVPVLMVDTERNQYYRVTESGEWLIVPYDEEN